MTVSVEATTGPNTASTMAQNATADILVAAGGDGTVREVIDGLAGSKRELAILPMGTANVLAAEIGLKPNVDAVVDTILYGIPRPLHLGRANDRHFAVMASIGFDADVVAEVNLELKKLIGKAAYVVAAIRRLISFQPRTFAVDIDGVEYRCGGVIISNGRYYGGKFVCVPTARVNDARLHACLLRASGRMDILRYAIALAMGRFPQCSGVEIVEGKEFKISGPEVAVQTDGDIIGQSPIVIHCRISNGLTLRMPDKSRRRTLRAAIVPPSSARISRE